MIIDQFTKICFSLNFNNWSEVWDYKATNVAFWLT